MDPLDNLTEEEFEEFFGKENLSKKNPDEFAKRAKALKESEALVKDINRKYLEGNSTYFDKINPLSDLPEDEFNGQKLGLKTAKEKDYPRGLIPSNISDAESEKYFDGLRLDRMLLS